MLYYTYDSTTGGYRIIGEELKYDYSTNLIIDMGAESPVWYTIPRKIIDKCKIDLGEREERLYSKRRNRN